MSPARMERVESAIRVVLAFHEAFNRHDVTAIMQLISMDCVCEHATPAPNGSISNGHAAITQYWQNFFRESPHAQLVIEEVFGLGQHCIMHWRYEWINAANTPEHVRGIDVFHVKQGQIAKQCSYVKA
jgi:ketosteroid isomerase-like protein